MLSAHSQRCAFWGSGHVCEATDAPSPCRAGQPHCPCIRGPLVCPAPSRSPWLPLTALPFLEQQSRGRTVRCGLFTLASPARCLRGFHGLIAHFCLVLSSIPWSGWTTLYVSIHSPKDALVSIPVSQQRTLGPEGLRNSPVNTQQSPRQEQGGGGAAAWGRWASWAPAAPLLF